MNKPPSTHRRYTQAQIVSHKNSTKTLKNRSLECYLTKLGFKKIIKSSKLFLNECNIDTKTWKNCTKKQYALISLTNIY